MQTSHVVQDTAVDALRKATGQTRAGNWNKNKMSSKRHVTTTLCHKCGNKHEPRQCPAYAAVCHKCGKNNHFSKVCKSSTEKNGNGNYKTKKVQNLESEIDSLYIGMIGSGNKNKTAHQARDTVWHETATVRGVAIKFKLDTNVLPMHMFRQLPGPIRLRPTKTVLIAFGGARLPTDGVASLECRTAKHKAILDFHVSCRADRPILGGDACEELQLVRRVEALAARSPQPAQPPATKEELLQRYAEVFTGLGEFPGVHHIHIDPSITPVIHACRNVPLSIMDSLRETLKDLQNRNVIMPVNEPTEWVNSLVATKKKNGELRVCLDPCNLNEAVKHQHYSIPTPEDMRSRLAGKFIFSILDEKDGYWQIKLDELCTFNTPWGWFRFLLLPFGIRSAREVFQQKNCETFGDAHVKFNKDKIQFKVDTVKYMGHVITAAGQRADDTKIKAIVNMPTPEDKQSLQRLLGMTKFPAQYIPNEASLTAPLRQLLKKDVAWQWYPHHSSALQTLKTTLTQAPVLRYYDHKQPLTLQADSSKDGLGACLMQDGRPVCYASRALTDTEKRYAQIEKELRKSVRC
uniref:Reverse transcriptase/retrotransposon-derived protein RNase H-like domain-containing protein n=1 Tax=Seriola dumerili TaxID=41447 RepID=A0A3B4T1P7_SERDU